MQWDQPQGSLLDIFLMTQWMAEAAKGRDIGGREIQGCEDPETEMERRCIQRGAGGSVAEEGRRDQIRQNQVGHRRSPSCFVY